MAKVELDCCDKPRHKDVIGELKRIHKQMHAGQHYGYEQSLLCDLIRKLEAADRLVRCCEAAAKHDLILLPSAAAIGEAVQLYREAQ